MSGAGQQQLPNTEPTGLMREREEDRQEFFIPIHGYVWLYDEERKIVDHPAFQRLSRVHQLGMAHYVFRGATHRRIEHSLGTVWVAQRMLDSVAYNCRRPREVEFSDEYVPGHPPTQKEIRLVRLAALLHDIGHLPYGHTFEDELWLLGKHDAEARLRKILEKEWWYGTQDMPLLSLIDNLYNPILLENPRMQNIKSHELLMYTIMKDPKKSSDTGFPSFISEEMGRTLAEGKIRIGVCRDIVGNTICADLLDYLHRDWHHIGKPRYFDERILQYMEISTRWKNSGPFMALEAGETPQIIRGEDMPLQATDAFDISLGHTPNLRTDGVSAILDLLESRYELSETVLFHRTKMDASAMLERALSLASSPPNAWHGGQEGLEDWLIDNSEEELIPDLLRHAQSVIAGMTKKGQADDQARAAELQRWRSVESLTSRLLRRELYKRVLTVPFQDFTSANRRKVQGAFSGNINAKVNRAAALHLLERDLCLPTGSIVMYCPEPRMNSKVAEVQLSLDGEVERFVHTDNDRRSGRLHGDSDEDRGDEELSAGHLQAQGQRFRRLWRVVFFIEPSLADRGEEFVSLLVKAIRVAVLNFHDREESINTAMVRLAREAAVLPDFCWQGRTVRTMPKPLEVAREEEPDEPYEYPLGARRLVDYLE